MAARPIDNQKLAFWLAPLVSTIALIVLFGFPVSPWSIARLMADPTHPFLQSRLGPGLGVCGVAFDAALLAYFMAVPIYLIVRPGGKLPVRQARAFAESWVSPLFGCLCGLAAAGCYAVLVNRRFPPGARALLYLLPAAVVLACGGTLMYSARF
jgi:hypothetical protein